MVFERDEAAFARLRARPENGAVLDAVESSSAHGDLGDVVFRLAESTGAPRVLPVAAADFPALVATLRDGDVVVLAASGMRWLLVRVGDAVPQGARLDHEEAPELGPGWWRVNPFDPAVSRDDTATELQRWVSLAGALR